MWLKCEQWFQLRLKIVFLSQKNVIILMNEILFWYLTLFCKYYGQMGLLSILGLPCLSYNTLYTFKWTESIV